MRSIVTICILALQPIAALGACGQVDHVPAEVAVDSLLAPTDTSRAAAVVESTVAAPAVLLTILLEGGRTAQATKVRLTSLGYLDATMSDGHIEHFPVGKVRAV